MDIDKEPDIVVLHRCRADIRVYWFALKLGI